MACLQALADAGVGTALSLGGAFGLAHYHEYRQTHDIDAWWGADVPAADQRRAVQALEAVLGQHGRVRKRTWGDVTSVELQIGTKTVFSFQVARRSAQLEATVSGLWPGGIAVDSFADLVASKMVALVERGAPRDFLDVYTVCQAGRATIEQCWSWWSARQAAAGEEADRQRAALAIQTHLARLESARPLANITEPEQKAEAEHLRTWFAEEFLGGIPD